MRESPREKSADAANPSGAFAEAPTPPKDTSSGVDAPATIEEPARDAKQTDGTRPHGSSDLDSQKGAHDAPSPNSGAKGNSGVGQSSDETAAKPATSPTGASAGRDEPELGAPEAAKTSTTDQRERRPSSDRALGEGDGQTDIALPEFEIERLEGDGSIMDRSAGTEARNAHPATGIWEQVEGPRDSDFAPGGYERSVVMLNPALKAAAVYRVFRGDIALVIGGELALDADAPLRREPHGRLTIREDPSSTSKFRRTPLELGGTPAVTVAPPSGSGPWSFDWRREGMDLIVGEKRYRAITREDFEKVRRGGGDVATAADAADSIASRPPETARRRVNETSFFGIRGGGKRICFIVDVSGSMGSGGKLDRLKQELAATIQGLKPDTQFAVVFFDSSTHTIAQTWLSGDADRRNAIQVIANQGSGSGTDPTGAFEFAFKTLNPLPDCIYYMTDGQTYADVVGLLRSLNAGPQKTSIHAIAFGDQTLEAAMKQIAAENNGTYLFVP
jgi:hypothetical protein